MMGMSHTSVVRRRGSRVRAAAVAVAVGALSVGVTAGTAQAGGDGVNQLRGVADFADATCPGLNLEPSTTGWSLDGCLQITSFTREQWNPSGSYQEDGTESFSGDLYVDGVKVGSGTFETTYQFRAKFGVIGDFSTEIFGRCQHPITSGTGVFADVEGRLDFKDVLDGPGAPYFPYRGHIRV